MILKPPDQRVPATFIQRWMVGVVQSVFFNFEALRKVSTYLTGDRLFSGNPEFSLSSNFDVETGEACVVAIDGTLKTVAASSVCDTGTTATLAAGEWGVMLISYGSSLTGTWSTGFSDEATAIARMPELPENEAPVGYITVEADAGGWTAGTDALAGGTGGTPAATTNYYNVVDPANVLG